MNSHANPTIRHLTETMLKTLAKYEALIEKGVNIEYLKPHITIIEGLTQKIRQTEIERPVAQSAALSTPPRVGGDIPGPKTPQNIPQVIHGAPVDNSAGLSSERPSSMIDKKEEVPTVPANDIRPAVSETSVTPDNIDAMADALIPNDSPAEPTIETAPRAK